ncbi:hypothetical protein [Nocardia grenadensis]
MNRCPQGHALTDGVDTFLIRGDRIQLRTALLTVHAKERFDTQRGHRPTTRKFQVTAAARAAS